MATSNVIYKLFDNSHQYSLKGLSCFPEVLFIRPLHCIRDLGRVEIQGIRLRAHAAADWQFNILLLRRL